MLLSLSVGRAPLLIKVEGVKEFDSAVEGGADKANVSNVSETCDFTILFLDLLVSRLLLLLIRCRSRVHQVIELVLVQSISVLKIMR